MDKWTLKDLLERLDRWTTHLKDIRILDKIKIKHKIQHSGLTTEQYSTMLTPSPNYSTIDRVVDQRSGLRSTPSKRKLNDAAKDTSFRLRPINRSAIKMEAFSTE